MRRVAPVNVYVAPLLSRLPSEVYERTTFANDVGAAIALAPSAGIVLRHLGVVAFTKARFCTWNGSEVVNGTTLEVLRADQYDAMNSSPDCQGIPYQTAYRIRLHSELLELAVSEDGA